jgi:plasmid stabilization system protein ParE
METEKLINSLEALLNEKRRANDFSEEAVASISKLVNDVIIEKSAEWKTQVEEAQAQKKELEEARAELSEKFDSISEQLKNAQDKIESLETEKSERLSEAAFNGRMEDLSSQFELSEDDLKIVVAEVKELDITEESFSSYKEKFEKIWSHKNKEFLKSQAEALEAQIEAEVQKRLSQNTEEPTEEVVEAALEQVEEEAEVVPNNNAESAETEESLAEKFAQAFSKDNISIKY